MKIIKVDAIDSTNTFLKDLLRKDLDPKSTCIWAKQQLAGRGQMGNSWQSEPYKNLTFSIFTPLPKEIQAAPFVLNMLVSLSILDTLVFFGIKNPQVKWPNDIMAVSKKVGGILIENCIKRDGTTASVIGVGLNVNQTNFENLPKASSLKKITQHVFSIEDILNHFLSVFQNKVKNYTSDDFAELKTTYESFLFRKRKVSTFKTLSEQLVLGIINGVTNEGKLLLELEDGVRMATYDVKEIQLMY